MSHSTQWNDPRGSDTCNFQHQSSIPLPLPQILLLCLPKEIYHGQRILAIFGRRQPTSESETGHRLRLGLCLLYYCSDCSETPILGSFINWLSVIVLDRSVQRHPDPHRTVKKEAFHICHLYVMVGHRRSETSECTC